MMGKFQAILIAMCAVAVCAVAASGAAAKITPTLATTFTQDQVVPTGSSGATTTITVPDAKVGSHADFNVDMTYDYGATGTTGLGIQDPTTYPAPSDFDENIKNLVVDTPPGLIGNPNAVPYEERCDVSTFETSLCPDSATVGSFWVDVVLLQKSSIWWLDIATLGPGHAGKTRVSLLKTDPEVPAQIGIYVHAINGMDDVRTILQVDPRTDHGLALRSKTTDIPSVIHNANDGEDYEVRIDHMKLRLFGSLANGHSFMTNPMSCDPWSTQMWATARFFNDNADSDPLGTGMNYKSSNVSTVQPDCDGANAIPFPISGDVAISSPDRNTSPAFDFTIKNPGVQGDGQASTTPKKIVTTIPASINVDVQQLGRTCQIANFYTNTCPATSKVGSVAIETPLLRAGLTGTVYLVKRNASSGLPDIGLYVTGAITFTQLGSNRYVGENFNQIETTFDDIPQLGFSKLTFHLDGGPQGLLRSLKCPSYNKVPALPTFTYNFFSYSGATAASTTPLNMANCFGIQYLKPYGKCLRKKLPIHPNYASRVRVKNVSVKIDGKKKATTRKAPFRFDLKIKKLKLKAKKKHKFELKATYDDGTISKKSATFKVCK